MRDPYAPESETAALIKADTRTPAERELARLMADAGDGEQGFEPEAALQRIALSLIAQLQDAHTEVVALHATEQNLRDGIAPQEDRAAPTKAQPAPVQEPVAYSVGRTLHWHEGRGVNDAQLYTTLPAAPVQEPIGYFTVNDYDKWEQIDGTSGKPLYDHPAAQPAVPEGWKLVPETPTNEMTSAMADALEDPENERSSWDLAENMYRAMLAATPKKGQP
jgi:hypothetical protein